MKEYGNLLGVAHFKTGDYVKAAEAFKAVLRVDKGSAMDLANLGLCEKFMAQVLVTRPDSIHHHPAATRQPITHRGSRRKNIRPCFFSLGSGICKYIGSGMPRSSHKKTRNRLVDTLLNKTHLLENKQYF